MKKRFFYSLTMLIAIYLVMSFVTTPDRTLMSHIVGALFFAIFFLISMHFIDKKLRANLLGKDTYLGNEIISQDLMSHQRGIITDGGGGYLLSDRFVFLPHKLNFSRTPLIIMLSDIEHISGCRILGLFDTRLKITLKSGKIERFVINENSVLYKTIEQKLKTA
jgi:hypothetical protein